MESTISLFSASAVLSVFASGLLAGALLTEALVLVPFWRKLPPREFLARHTDMASLLFKFYAPITVFGTALPITTMLISVLLIEPSSILWLSSGLIALALLGIYFAYFKSANAKFETGNLEDSEVVIELILWANWHNFRTLIACLGFLLSVVALTGLS